jgi:GNAT superfamily N-acetyltransferase
VGFSLQCPPELILLEEKISAELPMLAKQESDTSLRFRPLMIKNWADLAELFGPRGACGGCWCTTWRLSRTEFERNKGVRNRQTFRRIVASGEPTGVLAYSADRVVGWCAVAPRKAYVRLENSRVLRPVDDRPVWSVSCFYIASPCRGTGIAQALLEAAVAYARRRGAWIVEGYPYDLHENLPNAFVWTGLLSTFRRVGFKEVARRSPTRPMVRKELKS